MNKKEIKKIKEGQIEAERQEMNFILDETTDLYTFEIVTKTETYGEYDFLEICEKYGEKSWEFLERKLSDSIMNKLKQNAKKVDLQADVFNHHQTDEIIHELMFEFDKQYLDKDEIEEIKEFVED
ncbi:MAG: hypothetical protein V5A64_06530 [Candidatus Thermoplasmatota archaeon]